MLVQVLILIVTIFRFKIYTSYWLYIFNYGLDGDGNADNGYTKLSVGSYLNSFFGSSNVNTSPQVTLSAINFLERDYGAIIATINYSGSETISFSIKNHSFLELSGMNKIKLKDDYFYDETLVEFRIKRDMVGSFPPKWNRNAIVITAKLTSNNQNLVTETVRISETLPTIFADNNVDRTAQITLTPVSFYDKTLGATIATINYSGSETPSFSLASHAFLEIKSGTNQLGLKTLFL